MEQRMGTDEGGQYDRCSTVELLAHAASEVRARRASLIREWQVITAWADQNIVDCEEGAATLVEGYVDTGIPIAGPGAPLVSEFALMELIATLERTPDGGRAYVGRVIGCAWRLKHIYAAVLAGRCAPWKAERVADLTHDLSPEAAAHVDRKLAPHIRSCSWREVEHHIDEAITLYDPEAAEARREASSDSRRFDVHLDHVTDGVVHVDGVLDAADGADLDTAVNRRAVLLGKLGHDGSLDVRRAVAVGDLARNDLTLDLETVDESTGEITTASRGRRAVLNVHVSDTAITSEAAGGGDETAAPVGRWEDQQRPITVAQIKEWLSAAGTTVVVRPVIDLAGHIPVDSYEIPDRHRQQVELRDHHCAFPWCGRRASRCDLDHALPHNRGGVTCPCNLVPACRAHHRAKTFSAWRYVIVQPGTYLWITPNGRHFLVDHTGTRTLDPPVTVDQAVHGPPPDHDTRPWPIQTGPPCPS
ncbi:HNH endonuclease signature motif containing protein [Nocardioides sp. SYSU DS0651]|uniref:HNH endonuclease signature motif containing protein n=1 Tax=Nocardioides sp. SYSU DS0651 TaxID=3415955 RepID=UPI003F4AFA05